MLHALFSRKPRTPDEGAQTITNAYGLAIEKSPGFTLMDVQALPYPKAVIAEALVHMMHLPRDARQFEVLGTGLTMLSWFQDVSDFRARGVDPEPFVEAETAELFTRYRQMKEELGFHAHS